MKKPCTIPLRSIHIDDPFWNRYTRLVTEKMLPYQWQALHDRIEDAPPSHCIRNFRIAAGEEEGRFHGFVFQDSDLAKWLEAAAYSLFWKPDSELEKQMEDAIALIGRVQQSDGYLNTYFTIEAPDSRFRNLRNGHELYVAGHMIGGGCCTLSGHRKENAAGHCVQNSGSNLSGFSVTGICRRLPRA